MIDDRLWSDMQSLLAGMRARLAAEPPGPEHDLLARCTALLEREAKKLEALRAGQGGPPQHMVYLGISSFNKGRQEIGGAWQEGTLLGDQAFALTQEAYRLYQQTRPPLP